ncbi:MAG: hypothetical protein IE926_06050 [Micrococcales bacterium]|nr:hypothetical protein [Micrococcales bacterium]
MTWLVPLLSFVGGLVGAGAAGWVALRGQRQDARGEWRQRLDQAIALVTADTEAEQQIGDELLADLIDSDLGSDDDRELARRIARIRLGQQLAEGRRGQEEVDLSLAPGDDGDVEQEEAP